MPAGRFGTPADRVPTDKARGFHFPYMLAPPLAAPKVAVGKQKATAGQTSWSQGRLYTRAATIAAFALCSRESVKTFVDQQVCDESAAESVEPP